MNIAKRIKCFKYLIFSYIILLAISAAAQIVLGGIFVWGHIGYAAIVENKFWAPSTIQMCLGPITFIVCWLGWNATSKKHKCQLGLFSGCVVLVICVQFFICGWSLAMRESLPLSAEYAVENSFHNYINSEVKVNETHVWNRIQHELRCCGIHSLMDYQRIRQIPTVCCARAENPTDLPCSKMYSRGCLEVLTYNSRELLLQTAVAAAAFGLIQSIGVFCIIQLTLLLKRQPKEEIPTVTLRSKNMKQQELSPLSTKRQNRPEVEEKRGRSTRSK